MMRTEYKERPSASEMLQDNRIISKCRKFGINDIQNDPKNNEKENFDKLLDTIIIPKDFN